MLSSQNGISKQCDNMGQEEVKVNIEEVTINLSCVKKELDEREFDFDENRYKLTLTLENVFGESSKEQRDNRDGLIGFIDDEVIMETGTIKLEDVKTEEDLMQEIMKQSDCNKCGGIYKGYCRDCSSLSHILNNLTPNINSEPILNTVPLNMLEIREISQRKAVFALKTLPKGLILGPFEGVVPIESTTGFQWKIKDKKLVHDQNANWMQYIESVANHALKNLEVFHFAGILYFETAREIQEGEELLVCYCEEQDEVLKSDNKEDLYLIPVKKEEYPKVFACTLCCLGFRLERCLLEHKRKCPKRNHNGGVENFEITQCCCCKVWLEKQEYLESHMFHCLESYKRLRRNLSHHQPTERCKVSIKYGKDAISTAIDGSARDSTASGIIPSKRSYGIKRKIHAKEHSGMKEKNMHNSIKCFHCGFCKKKFNRKDHLKSHIKNKHSAPKRSNEISEKTDVKQQTIYSNTEGKKYKCPECSYQTNAKNCLKQHLVTHSGVKAFECDVCQRRYGRKDTLKIHIINQHSFTTYKKYKCVECSYQTNYKGDLIRHGKIHIGIKPFQCIICERKFTEKSSLKTHIKNHHSNTDEKEYKCSECSYRTNHKGNLKIHLNTHSIVKPFQCDVCGKDFTQIRSLTMHITNQHFNIKKKEYDKDVPKGHNIIHRRIKPYECDFCKKKYAQISTLELHIENQHSGTKEKKYKCSVCSYRTNHKGNLKIHQNTHSDVKPFGCDFCEKKFTQKGSLTTHIKSHHYSTQ